MCAIAVICHMIFIRCLVDIRCIGHLWDTFHFITDRLIYPGLDKPQGAAIQPFIYFFLIEAVVNYATFCIVMTVT